MLSITKMCVLSYMIDAHSLIKLSAAFITAENAARFSVGELTSNGRHKFVGKLSARYYEWHKAPGITG